MKFREKRRSDLFVCNLEIYLVVSKLKMKVLMNKGCYFRS